MALHLLVSAPGDVPIEDMAIVRKTISQWNLNLGRHVGLTVLPVSWTERPQAILNQQPRLLRNGERWRQLTRKAASRR